MEVITIESEEFKQIIKEISEIKSELLENEKQAQSAKWLDNDELSALLKVTKRTLQTYRDEGKISFSQIGSKIYYSASDIEEFFRSHYKKAFKYKS